MKWILPNFKMLGLCLIVMLIGQQAWGQTKLAITAISPSSPTAGGTFSVTIQSQNNGSNATNVSSATAFTLTTNGNAGAISGTVTGTIVSGSNSVTLTGLSLPNAGTGVTLTATRTSGMNLTAGTSSTFSVLAAPTKFVITSITPASPTEGVAFSVTVQAQNAGNVASAVLANTAFSLTTNGNAGTIGGTTTGTITAGSNSVTISGVTLSTAGTGATLTATRTSGDNLTDGISSAFTVVQTTPTKFIVTNITPASPTQGIGFSVTIQSVDANNNLRNVSNSTAFTLTNTGGGTIGGTTTGTILSGTNSITVSGVTLSNTGTATLTATRTSGNNLTAGTSSSFTVLASIATNLAITTITPASPTEGVAFSITVRSQDVNGNIRNVVAATDFVLTTNGNAGAISGTVTGTIPAGSSTATVSGIILPTAGTGVTLTATQTAGDALAADVSNTFTVITAASKLAITTITPASPTEGVGFSITVRSQDATGTNRNVTTATAFTLSTNGNAGAIGGTITGTIPAGSSTVTVSGIILPTPGTGVTLTATQTSGDNLTAGTSNTFTVIQTTPTKFIVTNITPASPTQTFGFSATIQAVDANNNLRNVAANTGFTLSSNGVAGTIGGTTTGTIPAGSNSVTVSGITLPNVATGATITATRSSGDNLSAGTSSAFNVIASVPTVFAITTITPASPTEGVGFSITVRSQDATGANRNVTAATSFTISTNGNAGAIGGTITGTIPAGSSTATVSGIILPTAGTGVTLTVTQTSGDNLASDVSSAFTVITAATKLAITTISPASPTEGVAFSITVRSQDVAGTNRNVTAATSFTLSTNGNAGAIGGTITGTIPAGSSTVTVSGIILSTLGTGATLTATRTSGNNLADGTSSPFNVLGNTIISTTTGGNWNVGSTWVGGIVPVSTNNVIIDNGATVTINASISCADLTVGQGTSGILQFETTTARTLTASGNVTISVGGTFRTGATGNVTTHVLSVDGNLTNNGSLDFSTNNNTAGADITFTGAANAVFDGASTLNDIRTITINKGTSSTSVLELTNNNFTIRGSSTDVNGFLTLTRGTFKISGNFTTTSDVFSSSGYKIPANTGLWINNTNFTISGQNGNPSCDGLLRVTLGTVNIGSASNNELTGAAGAVLTFEGGTTNFSSRMAMSNAITFNMSGSAIVNITTVGSSTNNAPSFEISNTGSTVNISGGTIVLVRPATGTGNSYDYDVRANTTNITGGTLQIGNASTSTGSTFDIHGLVTPTIKVNATNNPSVTLSASVTIKGDLSIAGTGTFNAGAFDVTVSGNSATNPGNISNSGTLTLSNAATTLTLNGTNPQTISSTGTVSTITSWIINNASGVTSNTSLTAAALTLTAGTLTFGPNTFTLTSNNLTRTSGLMDATNAASILVFANASALTLPATLFVNNTVNSLRLNGAGGVTLGANTTIAKDLSLTTGTLTVGAHTLTLAGNSPTRSTGVINATNVAATVAFTNTSAITLPAGIFTGNVNNMTLNGAGGVTLGSNTTIANVLDLTLGNLILGTNSLTVNTVSNASSSSYIVTDGTGTINKSSVTNFLFPVGPSTSSYNPVTITNGGNVAYTVNVNTTSPSGVNLQATKVVNRTWNITPTGTPTNVSLTFGYNTTTDGGSSFNAASTTAAMDGLHLVAGNWVIFSNNAIAAGTVPNSVTFTNSDNSWSTSSFSFGLAGAVLPIELLSINAKSQKGQNLVSWQTATEKNVAQFDIQRASNPQANWETIGSVKAMGNSQTVQSYQFVDEGPLSISYYRLRSVDLDGQITLSNIVSVEQNNKGTLKVYPTAVTDKMTISTGSDEMQTYTIFDLFGRAILTGQVKEQKELNINNLIIGTYIMKVGESSVKFLKN